MCNKIIPMYVKRGNFSNVILFGIMAFCLYFIQRIAIFEPWNDVVTFASFREQYFYESLVGLVSLIGLSVWYAIIEWKKGDFKIHLPLIILFSILFIISVVNIFVLPAKVEYSLPIYKTIGDGYGNVISIELLGYKNIVVNTNLEQRFLYVFSTFATLYLAYLMLFTLPRKIRYIKQIDWIMWLTIIFGLVAVIYSYVFEIPHYQHFFSTIMTPQAALPSRISSFLGHKNGYGLTVTLAAFACLYLHHTERKWWFIVASFFFAVQNFFTTSKTCMLICLVVLPIYYIVVFVLQFKKHWKRSIIILSSIFAVIAAFASMFIVRAINNEFFPEFFNMTGKVFDTYFVKGFDYFDHLSGRYKDYEMAQGIIKGHLGIGVGFGLFNALMFACEVLNSPTQLTAWNARTINHMDITNVQLTDSPHSFYYQLLGTGGIVMLVVYALILCYVIFAAIRVFKKHKLTVLLCLLILGATILHGMSEATALFFFGPYPIGPLLLTLMSAVIVLSLYHHDCHPSENRKYAKIYLQKPVEIKKLEPSVITQSLYFFLTPTTVILCVIAPCLLGVNLGPQLWLFITMLVIGGSFVILPIVAHFIFDRKTPFGTFFKQTVFPYLVLLVTFSVMNVGYYFILGSFTWTVATLLAILTCIFHFFVFLVIDYFRPQAGIISFVIDVINYIVTKRQKKYIVVSNEEDKKTLQELVFSKLNFKRNKQNETGNN